MMAARAIAMWPRCGGSKVPPKKAMRIAASYRELSIIEFLLGFLSTCILGPPRWLPLPPPERPILRSGPISIRSTATAAQTLCAAVDRLGRLGRVAARSSLYETEPVGYRDQPAFLNAVVALKTQLEPLPLLRALLAIERELGRDRSQGVPNGPRTLDLDLLLLGDRIVAGEELSLPHPALAHRRFVLAPLAEIAPQLRHPQRKQTMAELLALLPDEGENRVSAVRRLPQLAEPGWPML